MKKLTVLQRILICLFIAAGVCLFALSAKEYFNTQEIINNEKNQLIISHDSGFYSTGIVVEVMGKDILEVYYTLDGSDPSMDNPTAELYSNGIYIMSEGTECAYTVRMLAYFEDGTTSDIINRSFIIGDNVEDRYDIPVLTVTSTDEFFFDEEFGIMSSQEGKVSRGRESEGEVFMTLFDTEGNVLLSQNCGFRLFGNFSREKNQRSFRLFARSEYDEQNDFEYALFDNQFAEDNTLISEFKRLDVRNAGQDNGYAFIRGELATRLSLDAGYPDAPCATPVAVYINDRYYGFYWIITNFNETYYRNTYGEYEGTMYTFEGKINDLSINEYETDETYISLANDYEQQIYHFATCDLTDEANWTALNDYMDVENFLQYIAIHHYVGNTDSFFNNYRIYRYVAPEGGSYTEDSVFDGRFRFLLFDLDWAFAFQGGDFITHVEDLTTTMRLTTSSDYYKFFQNLMQRKDCQEYYIRYTLSMQNHYFSYEYAENVMYEMHESRENELRYMYTTTNFLINNSLAPDVTSDADIQRELDRILHFLQNRKYYTTEDLSGSFGPFTTYDLFLENPEEANITLDYATLNKTSFSGLYYKEIPLSVSVEAKPGYRFDYWLINGEKYEEPSFEITPNQIDGDSFTLECFCSPDPDADICITAVKSNTGNDYIELTNLGSQPRYLNSYYLTDDDTWNKSSLPALKLDGGKSIIIYCKNHTGLEALGQPYVNFNLSAGETLSLYRNGETALQSLTVPSLGTEEGVYTMDMETGIFREIIPE